MESYSAKEALSSGAAWIFVGTLRSGNRSRPSVDGSWSIRRLTQRKWSVRRDHKGSGLLPD